MLRNLLPAAVLLLAASAAAVALEHDSSESRNINQARDGLNALRSLTGILNSKIFERSSMSSIISLQSRILTGAYALIEEFKGSNSGSSSVLQLGQDWANQNAIFDRVNLNEGAAKNVLKWNTDRVIYFTYERDIIEATRFFDNYVRAAQQDKERTKASFIRAFDPFRAGVFRLYRAIVDLDPIAGSSLADALHALTANHRPQSMSFLVAMNRVILRGAMMEIAYESLTKSSADGLATRIVWDSRMDSFVRKMKRVEDVIKAAWYNQMKTDVANFINRNTGLSNKDFSYQLYLYLAEKFDWQYWIAISYRNVSGGNNHWFRAAGGINYFRVAGNRNVVVGRTDPKTSRWSQSRANQVLQQVDNENHSTSDARFWEERVNSKYTVDGRQATLSMAICWGCDVWLTSLNSRRAYRRMTHNGRERVHSVLFG